MEENPFIKEKENKEKDVIKGLVEEVKALYKKNSSYIGNLCRKAKEEPLYFCFFFFLFFIFYPYTPNILFLFI